jgi:hypothetical protein
MNEILSSIPKIDREPLKYVFEKDLVLKEGLWLEFGVFSGKSINYFSQFTDKNIYGFDSFEGLPEKWDRPDINFHKGFFKVNLLPQVRKNVKLIKGWFNETLPYFMEEHKEPITFIHIDCDLYSSTKTIFDLLGKKICNGCVIVFDELINYPNFHLNEWKAWEEFVKEYEIEFEWIGVNADIQYENIVDRGSYDQKVAVKILNNKYYV